MSQYNRIYFTFYAIGVTKTVEARRIVGKHEIIKFNLKSLPIEYRK
jgi:hypothetical protein